MIVSPRLHSLLPLRPFGYALLITLAMLVLHQGPVLAYALGQIDLSTRDGWMILAALELVQAVPGILVLTLAGMLSPWLMKILAAALLIGNAVARHFMVTYGIVIDPTMIGNILNTDSAETGALINLPMLAGIALWGVLPAALAVWLPVQRGRLLRMAGALALVLAVFVGGVYAVSGVWLWFDQHNSRLGPRILPWGYLGNVARYGAEYQRRNRPVHPLPDATLSPLPGPRTIVVLVIGEAARRDHLQYFGYDRETNPFTRDLGLIAFGDGQSCATYTLGSVACIVSHLGGAANVTDPWENLPAYLARSGVPVVVRVNNSGLPPMPGVPVVTSAALNAECGDAGCLEGTHDAVLLRGLMGALDTGTDRDFVLLHFNGSHGPEYFAKYPPEFAVFAPTCQTTLVNDCDPQSLINAYDNSLRYTDWVLAQLIGQLDALPDTQALVLYVSDHGQSLGENGVYLHGLPNAIAPEEQRRVPLLMWMDDDFATAHGIDRATLARPVPDPQDQIFHTVLDALGVDSPVYRPDRDLLRSPRP